MKAILKVLIISIALYGIAYADEWTLAHQIGSIQVKELDSNYYITTPAGGWGAPSCPDAARVIIKSSLSLAKEILSTVFVAKVTNAQVVFKGVCSAPASAYFYADNITLY